MTKSRGIQRARLAFDDRIEVVDLGYVTPCHRWLGNIAKTGYGRHGEKGVMWLAHRYAYVRAHGQIASGLSIDHLCRQRTCVNPAHLDAVTLAENTRRQWGAIRDQMVGPRCDHLVVSGSNCLECARARKARHRAKLKRVFGTSSVPGGFGLRLSSRIEAQRSLRDRKAAEIANAYLAGEPTLSIARRFGFCDRARVYHFLKVAGVTPNRAERFHAGDHPSRHDTESNGVGRQGFHGALNTGRRPQHHG